MWKFPSLALAFLLAVPAQAQTSAVGRPALPDELTAWDIDVRPDGKGLPRGAGSVRQGEALYMERCASCHGEFGEGIGRWPEIAGGHGSLRAERPLKTVGSYWPNASTLFDYIRRAMPFGNAQSLTIDELYAITAYVLHLNDVITDENFVLSDRNFSTIRLPNAAGFRDDDRDQAERGFWRRDVCMTNCKPEPRITSRARDVNVTPEDRAPPKPGVR